MLSWISCEPSISFDLQNESETVGTEGSENAVLSENRNVERSISRRERKRTLKQVMYQF